MQEYKHILQARQAQDVNIGTMQMLKEFVGAVCVILIPILMLFIGTMLGL